MDARSLCLAFAYLLHCIRKCSTVPKISLHKQWELRPSLCKWKCSVHCHAGP